MTTTAIDNEGNLWSWGANTYGQVGNGTKENQLTPVQITSNIKFIQLYDYWYSNYHSVALDQDGNIWTWGKNSNGQLGDGTQINRLVPTLVKYKQKINLGN